jgi:hypothetical protein
VPAPSGTDMLKLKIIIGSTLPPAIIRLMALSQGAAK